MSPDSPYRAGREGRLINNPGSRKARRTVRRHESHAKRRDGKRDAERAVNEDNVTLEASPRRLSGDFVESEPRTPSKGFGTLADLFADKLRH